MTIATPSATAAEQNLRIGRARLSEHWLNQAEIHFQQVLADDPVNSEALHLLGITAGKLGRRDEGIALINRAADSSHNSPVVWFDLAVALRDAARPEEAETAYRRGVEQLLPEIARDAVPLLGDLNYSVDRGEYVFKLVDYQYTARVRYAAGSAHPQLAAQIAAGRGRFAAFIDDIAREHAEFADIAVAGSYSDAAPFWLNTWFPPLDGMALHTMLSTFKPRRFVEIGSGVSTKFARRAVSRKALTTRLVSIDPQPRNEIDRLADEIVRAPLERIKVGQFDDLAENDILFLDSSHRSFQNSDVTAFFLDVLPRLKPGVIVHIHDIYLPYDYPSGHVRRLWNEQYLLATALLFGGVGLEILFPCWFACRDKELAGRIDAAVRQGPLSGLSIHGASFWLRKC